jgi:hypothetical protein
VQLAIGPELRGVGGLGDVRTRGHGGGGVRVRGERDAGRGRGEARRWRRGSSSRERASLGMAS